MGWLGWTEQQTLDASIPAIEIALEGRVEMLKACFGSNDKPPDSPAPVTSVMPAQSVFAAFRSAAQSK